MTVKTFKGGYFDPVKIALSGQAFRITPIDDTHTELVAKGRYLQIADMGGGKFAFSCEEDEFDSLWKDYFDLDTDYKAIEDSILTSDTYLRDAARYGRGIRILRQDIFETVISYIISQRRSIPSITTCVNRISRIAGDRIVPPSLEAPFVKPSQNEYYAFPCAASLLEHKDELDEAGLGYRLPYVISACRDFQSGKLTEEMLISSDDDRLFSLLTGMYGVGIKVANCAMLFAFHRTGRFPVDVWIQRIQDRYYGGSFNCTPYPDTAGIMQQFMFFYERTKKD